MKEIQVHEFDEHQKAIHWLQSQNKSALVVPLNPLFIDQFPNILPLDYFFQKNTEEVYERFDALLQKCYTYAPSSLSRKSIRKIADDLFHYLNLSEDPQDHAFQWIHQTLNDYNNDAQIKSFQRDLNRQIEEAANWINSQYKAIIFFGYDHQQLSLVNLLINLLHQPITWVLPSQCEKSSLINDNERTIFFESWARHKQTKSIAITMNAFKSLEDECQEVISQVKKMNQKVALVIPNQSIKNKLILESMRQGLNLRHSSVKLDDTKLGGLLVSCLNWIKNKTLDGLYELLLAWDWDDMEDIFKRVSLEISGQQYARYKEKSFHSLVYDIDETHQIYQLLKLKDFDDVMALFHQIKAPFAINDEAYLQFQTSEKIMHLLNQAKLKSNPNSYIMFMLGQTLVDQQSFEDPRVICIEPESICKFPSHLIWVLGLGHETWRKKQTLSYLSTDSMNADQDRNAIRNYFAIWTLKSQQLLGASYSIQYNDQENHPLETIKSNRLIVKPNGIKKDPFQRVPVATPKTTITSAFSPSSLQLFQRCPYAFYLKKIIGISMEEPETEYQMIGTIIHQLIEKIAKKEILNTTDVKIHLQETLNPLIALMIEAKILDDWNIDDIVSWVNQFSGQILTEYELSETIHNIKLKGRADLIFLNNNAAEVIDVKSGKIPSKKEINNYDYIQLGIYILLIQKTFKTPELKASLLAKEQHFSTPIDSANEVFSDYMTGLKQHILNLFDRLSEGKFDPSEALSEARFTKQQCRVCEYYHICHYKDRHQR